MIVAITFAVFILVIILIGIGVTRCRKNKIRDDVKGVEKYKAKNSITSL